jgi:hypothetical protein
MKVLIIPEDPTLDQHILKPIVERTLADLGRSARVFVLQDPHLRGIQDALDADQVTTIIRDNPMIDLFLLIADRDCDRFGNTAKAAARQHDHPEKLIACLAVEEVEVWMLALHRGQLEASWNEVRAECDPKERFARPFLDECGWSGLVGRGRKRAMRDLGRQWTGLVKVCPEIAELKEGIDLWLQRSP